MRGARALERERERDEEQDGQKKVKRGVEKVDFNFEAAELKVLPSSEVVTSS